MKTGLSTAAAVLAAALALEGCGQKPSPVEPEPAPAPTANAERPASDSPEAAIRRVAKGLEQNRPQVLWQSLPASYQNDLNRIVRNAAARIDPEVWERSVAVARRSLGLLKTRREFLLSDPSLQTSMRTPDEIASSLDALEGIADALLASDLMQLERLKQFDGRSFLETTGAQLMREVSELSEQAGQESLAARLTKQFQGMKVTEVKREGDTAVLRIDTGDPNVPAQEHEYVRIEGKWLPRGIADGWVDAVAALGSRLESVLGADASGKSRKSTLAFLAQIEKTLDELDAAPDAERFHTVFHERIIVPALMAAGRGEAGGNPAETNASTTPATNSPPANPEANPAAPVADARVTVIVRAALDEKARDLWQERLAEATDKPSIGLALPTGDGSTTRFEVTPVADVQQFAKRLKLSEVKSIDDEKRTVTIEPPK